MSALTRIHPGTPRELHEAQRIHRFTSGAVMRRPGAGVNRRNGFRGIGGGGGGPDFLLNYQDGTHTRTSAAAWALLPTSIPEYVSGEERILSGGDYATEGARTSAIDGDSSRLDSAAWALAASATVTSEDVASLFDGESADTLSFASGADSGNHTDLLGTADGETYTVSVIAWTASGTKAFRLRLLKRDGTTVDSGDLTATTSAQLFTYTASLGTGATQPELRIVNEAGGGTGAIAIDHVQAEAAGFASSPIRSADASATTRQADSMVIPSAALDPRILDSPWELTWTAPASDAVLGAGATTYIMYMSATQNIRARVFAGGVGILFGNGTNAITANVTFAAGEGVLIKADPASGDVRAITDVSDEWASGAAGSWPAATDLRIMERTAGTQMTFGGISRPVAIASVAA